MTDFFYAYHDAINYYEYGAALGNGDIMREGVFRVADSFMLLTNMTYQCWYVYYLSKYSVETDVNNNIQNPLNILINIGYEFFYLFSNIAA